MTTNISSFKWILTDVYRSSTIYGAGYVEYEYIGTFILFFEDIAVHCEAGVHFIAVVDIIPVLFLVFVDLLFCELVREELVILFLDTKDDDAAIGVAKC